MKLEKTFAHALNYIRNISNIGDVYGLEPIEDNLKRLQLENYHKWWRGIEEYQDKKFQEFNFDVKFIFLPKVIELLKKHPDNELLKRYYNEMNNISPERYYNDVQSFQVLLMAQAKELPIANIEPFPDDIIHYEELMADLATTFKNEMPKINMLFDMFERPGKQKGQWFSATNKFGIMVCDCSSKSPYLSLEDCLKIVHEYGHFLAHGQKEGLAPDLVELPAVKMEYWFVNEYLQEPNLKRIAKQYLDKKYQDYLVRGIELLKKGFGRELDYRYALAHYFVRNEYYPH